MKAIKEKIALILLKLSIIKRSIKINLPKFHVWQHKNAICLLPYIGIQWYEYQGKMSLGCLKGQVNCGWILWSASLMWKHNSIPEHTFKESNS